MTFLRTIIARPVMTTMLVVVMLVMGIYSYSHLVTELIPSLDFPVVVVTTVYPGAAPGEVETQVTKKIEDEVATLANIDELTSTSMESMSQVVVQFELEVSEDQASIDVKDKVDAIVGDLPEDAEAPVITKFDIAGEAVVELAVSGPRPLPELYEIVDKRLKDRLSRVAGVAEVDIIGTQERQIRVAVQPERLRAYGLTLGDVLAVLAASNLNVPVGHITRQGGEVNVRMLGEVRDPAELADFRLNLPGGGTIPLSEVASIVDTTEEVREASTWNGEPAITVAVKKRSDGNEIAVADGVFAALDDLRGELDADISIDVVRETASFVRESRADVLGNIAVGIVLTGLLLFLFLHDWRQTLIAAVAMPVSVVASFMLMEAAGLHPERDVADGPGHLHRHPGDQLDRGAGEHLAAGQRGRRAPGGRRPRHRRGGRRGAGLDPDQRGGVHADRLHERHRGPLLPAVRPDGGVRDPVLAGGQLHHGAHAGGPHAAPRQRPGPRPRSVLPLHPRLGPLLRGPRARLSPHPWPGAWSTAGCRCWPRAWCSRRRWPCSDSSAAASSR